jgi:hypothetical protein
MQSKLNFIRKQILLPNLFFHNKWSYWFFRLKKIKVQTFVMYRGFFCNFVLKIIKNEKITIIDSYCDFLGELLR